MAVAGYLNAKALADAAAGFPDVEDDPNGVPIPYPDLEETASTVEETLEVTIPLLIGWLSDFADIDGVGEDVRDTGESLGQIVRPEHARTATIWLLETLRVADADQFSELVSRHPDLRTLADESVMDRPGQQNLSGVTERATATPTPPVQSTGVQPGRATSTSTPLPMRGTPTPRR